MTWGVSLEFLTQQAWFNQQLTNLDMLLVTVVTWKSDIFQWILNSLLFKHLLGCDCPTFFPDPAARAFKGTLSDGRHRVGNHHAAQRGATFLGKLMKDPPGLIQNKDCEHWMYINMEIYIWDICISSKGICDVTIMLPIQTWLTLWCYVATPRNVFVAFVSGNHLWSFLPNLRFKGFHCNRFQGHWQGDRSK